MRISLAASNRSEVRNQANRIVLGCMVAAICLGPARARAVTPAPEELGLSRAWAEAGFGAEAQAKPSGARIAKEDAPDLVSRGRSWVGTPFQIGAKVYSHGVAFNANKDLAVSLDRPAARFLSDIGLENNEDTRRGAEGGSGSVVFQVLAGDKELFKSPVLRLKDGPQSINVPLGGAREFVLRVSDAGDGRAFDQALWGGAMIELEDGSRLRLQDLAWAEVDANPARVAFVYGGKPSRELLGGWKRTSQASPLAGGRQLHEVVYHDPDTGLELQISAQYFAEFPAVEWVAHFRNTGSKDTPILEDIQALDSAFTLPISGAATLHWAKGGVASFDDFAPQTESLRPGTPFTLREVDGRSSSEVLPFFNLEGAGSGVVLGLGWSGRWTARFETSKAGAVRARAGMSATRLVLHPGEAIRTPRVVALFYTGNQWRGQNLWRQFILTHHRPLRNGQPLVAPITFGNWGGTPAAVHLDNIQKFIEHRLPMDYYWIDAEWFGKGGWAENVGNWQVKTEVYPEGFPALSRVLRRDHRELMLWFEPERVMKGTAWHQQHRDWMLDLGGDTLLLNLGNSNACQFVTEFISGRIEEFGLGCYRQDFNMDPGPYWAKADAPDRQGMAEIRHIEGLYAFWDGLLARHPHLILDNCASGGRRLDLETLGRATPFWRTDGPRDPIAHQCHTYGLLAWVPLSATSQDREGDTYEFRSSMCSSLCLNWNHSGDGPRPKFPADFPYDWARQTLEQYVRIRDFYYGDYYPLTSYSQASDTWMAYQLDRPDTGQGLVVALRRPESPYETAALRLQALDPQATYRITNLDTQEETQVPGQSLLEQGLPLTMKSRPGSLLLVYRKL